MAPSDPRPVKITIIEAEGDWAIEAVLRLSTNSNTVIHVTHADKVGPMGDSYLNYGQAGAMGNSASADGNTFLQNSNSLDNLDLTVLARQLDAVRIEMKKKVVTGSSAEEDSELGHVAEAQVAATKGDKGSVIEHLKRVGAWTLEVARTTGSEIAALTIAHLISG